MGRVPIVMRPDGSISAMKATDLKEVAERDARIHQLEELNRVLAAEVDRARPVVEAAMYWYGGAGDWSARLAEACVTYEVSKSK